MSNEIEGLEKCLEAFDLFELQTEEGVKTAIEKATKRTFDESQRDCPYDSVTPHEDGYEHLRDTGKKEISPDGLEGSVSYGTDHNFFVEEGTTIMEAQPFLNPAFERSRSAFMSDCRRLRRGERI